MIKQQYIYKAIVTEVYDGDTITAVVDCGFRIKFTIKLRLAGINAPEVRGSDKSKGVETRDYLRALILNKEVTIETFKDGTEKYGRYLANVWLDSLNVNLYLIEKGYAVKY